MRKDRRWQKRHLGHKRGKLKIKKKKERNMGTGTWELGPG